MCGIVGIWRTSETVDPQQLARMIDTLRHRGPNDSGQWQETTIGMAHRRLSILDVSAAGHQPMSTPDGRFHIVFNGEIFNYRELAKKHLPDVTFVSTSDTEVLLHLLACYGEHALEWLRGMYAFALWDREKRELLAARDPFGKKPFYYTETLEGLWFASEPKAILAAMAEAENPTAAAVTTLMSYEYVPSPDTPWRGLQQLPLGTYRRWLSPNQGVSWRFWQPHYSPKTFESETVVRERLDALLRRSVERRLVSDVPVGLLLSGGLDSSTIGWYMRQCGAKQFHSFSVTFSEPSFDESPYAHLAARTLGTEHHSLKFTLDTFYNTLRELVPLMDIPLADASLLPTYAVSKLARQFVTVVLDGDGSDELFGGYGTFQAAEVAERLTWLYPLMPFIRAAACAVPVRYTDFSFDFKLKSFVRGLGLPLAYRNQVWLGSFTEPELKQLLQPAWYQKGVVRSGSDQWRTELKDLSVIDQVSLLTIYQYLHNDILVKLDRATMAASIEARTPFLDIDVADLAFRLPAKYKRNKYLLKCLMASRLPSEIVERKKKGFGIPLGFWLRGPLYDWGRQVLAADKLRADGIIEIAYVDRLWREHRSGAADHRKKLWTLLTWQLWYDQWVTHRSPASHIPTPSAAPRG